ncbi:LacI family transcriptional regulator [Bacillaceae bacterium SIJ1]|uniref:LacI family DNA-binding transcriptional regulator n=1 Tax=Litoribacterium kuwaitense TaxID=1398745 RepID=UPI0013EDAB6E|nr:LacI family DNA-binding transcriptional regulator [Litoribacterium kuwaitense]NGP46778.1 LacI family transcriptional regulator [Litoribacterium kuwaitense]
MGKITIYDIAKISGFSPKTVSRVVNGEKNVRASTYEAIQKVIEELNYTPNSYARHLRSTSYKNILISVKKSEAYPLKWFHILLEKLILECRAHQFNVMVEYFDQGDDLENSLLRSGASFIDGAVLFYEEPEDERISLLRKLKKPFVVFGKSNTDDVNYVTNDDYGALYSLTEYLLAQGHRQMMMMIGANSIVNADRVQGAKDAYEAQSFNPGWVDVVYDMRTTEDVYRYAHNRYKELKHLPDAIFVSGDEKVAGLFRAFHELQIDVPRDVSVIGFDDIPLAAYYVPSLTTIAQNYVELAKKVVHNLLDLMEDKKPTSLEIPTELILRESVRRR